MIPPLYENYIPDFGNGAKRSQKEYRLQVAAADYLRGEIHQGKNVIRVQVPFDMVWFHVANENKDKKDAHFAKRKGVRAGVADFIILHQGKPIAIEMKTDDGTLSPDQQSFSRDWRRHQGTYHICKTVQAVRDFLIGLGLQCKNMQCIEPSYITDADKKRIGWELMKP